MKGLLHIYCGDGKGKTTAAIGLSVRAAGAGKKVLFVQFFKDGTSSEHAVLSKVDGIDIMVCRTHYGLFKRLDEEGRRNAARDYGQLLENALLAAPSYDLLVLDESISACNHGTISEERLAESLESRPEGLEVVLTGRKPSERLIALAGYVTEMKKIRHPFDEGVPARKGIEF
ncbi:MAG: cob(I)yrinic acid a,c-diamide adenosyltransferase [Firmicutes bacterium]|nr:cob(I)yrinic acid a,c-diamide adenosyltransferase [Bacillota bacterium]